MLKQTIWLRNHTSHTKVYFNEFVANVLGDSGIVFLTSDVKEAVRGQKHPKKVTKELIYQKKYLIKVSQQPKKTLGRSNQI